MGIPEWIAIAAVILTFLSSSIGVAHYFGKKHAEVILEMTRIRADMQKVELSWETRLIESARELQQQLTDGPKWMVERLDKYDSQLRKVVQDATISLDVAKQHGEEMNQMREMITDSENRNEERHNLILSILRKNEQS